MKPVYIPTKADKVYQQKRNALIPSAEKYAISYAGARPVASKDASRLAEWKTRWDMGFMAEMDRLARENGLVA